MVVRVRCDTRFERRSLRRITRFFGRRNFRLDALERFIHAGQRLAGFEIRLRFFNTVVTHRDVGEHHARLVKLLVQRECKRELIDRALNVTCVKFGLCAAQLFITSRGHDFVQKLPDDALRLRALKSTGRLLPLHRNHGRQRLDAKHAGHFLLLVCIHLSKTKAPAIFNRQLLKNRRQRLARRAPRCPEINDDRRHVRRSNNLRFKVFKRDVEDVGRVGHGGFSEQVYSILRASEPL